MSDRQKHYVTVDGNEAAAYIAYAFTEIAAIYPITPSSPMAGKTDAWSAKGKKNIFGRRVRLVEMQAESGAIAAVHGALQTGALATSYTSSQGLMLMIPTMHRIAGERLPGVLHVASRTVGGHALSIFGDHSDVMNCRQTGWALLSSGSVLSAASPTWQPSRAAFPLSISSTASARPTRSTRSSRWTIRISKLSLTGRLSKSSAQML